MAVATSSEVEYTEFSLRQAGLEGSFSVMVTGDQVAEQPPSDTAARAAFQVLRSLHEARLLVETLIANTRSAG